VRTRGRQLVPASSDERRYQPDNNWQLPDDEYVHIVAPAARHGHSPASCSLLLNNIYIGTAACLIN
jgi:hypothetical protein